MRKTALFSAIFAGIAGIVLAVLFAVSGLLANFALTVPPATHSSFTPATLGLPYDVKSVTTSDGVHLKGWWVPFPGSAKPPMIIIHGLGAGKEFMVGFIALAHQTGHDALVIDLRGHGESDKGITTLGAREPLDIAAWIGLLRQEGHPTPPILWGVSLGAVTALRAGAENPVSGVIADAPFDTLRHTLAVHARLMFNLPEFPLVPLTAWQIGRRGIPVSEVDSLRAVRQIHAPLLVIAAEHDARMSYSSVHGIYEAGNEPKRFYLIPGEDHETRKMLPAFREAVVSFLDLCDAQAAAKVK